MNAARTARQMLRGHRYGTLCTISKKFDGHPFGSITPYLVDHDSSLLIFISALAEHTRNILHDPRVSLVTHNQNDPHIQSQGRVTVIGSAQAALNRKQASSIYLRHFPEARDYLEMQDFSFYRIRPFAIRHIGGFGKIHWVDMENYTNAQSEQFAQHEESSLIEINTNYQNILRTLLQQRYSIDTVNVQAIGFDCDGLTVLHDEQVLRLDFAEAVSSPSPDALVNLAQLERT